ncbi:MAG: chromate efflux transporter [Burkholderiaceae bacterium]
MTQTKTVKPDDDLLGNDGRPWPGIGEAFWVWLRIAMLSFGGPAGQIAVMHRILVEEKRWLGEQRFLHALNFCMLLPGPEAQQLAVYIGWLMHRTRGGLIAGLLFILPGFVAIMLLSWVYAKYGDVSYVGWLFFGLKAAVLAIVLNAVIRIGKRALQNHAMVSIAGLSFFAIFFFGVSFPLIILSAALIGYIGSQFFPAQFNQTGGHGAGGTKSVTDDQTILGSNVPNHARTANRQLFVTGCILLVLWLMPTVLLLTVFGSDNVFSNIAVFFSQMAVVTFGGAYAVLAYVAQAAVQTHGWLQPGEMLDGLGMAETTPGPLIIVTQFVGFMGAFRNPGNLNALQAGMLGAILTTWVTFVPCFLWIFLGAPYVEKLRENQALSASLTAITAAVVGVVLNLAVWFSVHVLFVQVGKFNGFGLQFPVPEFLSLRPGALILSLIAIVATFYFKTGTGILLAAMAVGGIALGLAGLA